YYFISGSCNGPSGEQNLFTMGVDYGGTIMFSHIIDKTNYRNAGASVMYYAPLNTVYLMANNSISHQFQIARCDPYTGFFVTPSWMRHQIAGLPIGSGVDQNGFRLQQTPNKQIVIGGYLSAPTGAMPEQLTPFQMVLRENLTFLAAKIYQSGNNSPMSPSYFEENGNSVFINTPDMIAYNKTVNRTYLVNQNTVNGGFDLHVSSLLQPSKCEKAVQVTTYSDPHNIIGSGNFNPLPMYPNQYDPHEKNRGCSNIVLCQYPPASSIIVNTPNTALLAPNPATNKLTVTLEEETIQSVLVYDMKGNRVLSQKAAERASNEMTLAVEKLDQGAYIVEITTKEGIIYRERFVKE
uniref:T9SS type A sorting domain-containing protein n=1 Tax=Fluviicola sp. TaxID=1917219 RepID=UPI002615823C